MESSATYCFPPFSACLSFAPKCILIKEISYQLFDPLFGTFMMLERNASQIGQ